MNDTIRMNCVTAPCVIASRNWTIATLTSVDVDGQTFTEANPAAYQTAIQAYFDGLGNGTYVVAFTYNAATGATFLSVQVTNFPIAPTTLNIDGVVTNYAAC